LLAPIPGQNPSGENLQYAGLYDEIREARRSEDNLTQGDWQHEAKTAEWPKAVGLTTSALATKSKDLQICGWMMEALVELFGFVGLRDGLKVMRGLHENFWDTVYPEADEDLEARANALSWMDTKLAVPLKKQKLTKTGTSRDYSTLDWEDSVKFDIPENLEGLDSNQLERIDALRAQAEAEGKTTGEEWRKAKNATRRAFYEETHTILEECWHEFQALDQVMDEKFARHTPGLGALKKTLEDIRSLVDKLLKEKRILEPDSTLDADGTSAGAVSSGDGSSAAVVGPIRTRADALRRLSEVAQYFQTTEPHSPVAYLVQRAIKWGQMPLDMWLEDVIKDGNVLGQLRETLGLNTPVDSENLKESS
jgi:type VI secretion system protein ImpA